ncbi:MAG: hypothetical protein K2O33_04220 [Muribaculaceae bacterium]|nr:hypothetical protein [Muribaculaceae bacterium]
MNPDIETRIRQLLDRFFDGSTTTDEETELEQLISQADNLPTALETDIRTFRLCREPSTVEVPDGLEERLEAAIDSRAREEFASTAKESLRRVRRAWLSAAAAAVVVVALMIPALRTVDAPAPCDPEIIAKATPVRPISEKPAEATIATPTAGPVPKAATTTQTAPVKSSRPQKTEKANHSTIIVDDPQEAAAYLAMALDRATKTRHQADTRISECGRQLERVGSLLDKISARLKADIASHEEPIV